MPDTLSATDLRRWATQCTAQSTETSRSHDDRARLMRMHDSLLSLADNADWLTGAESSAQAGSETAPLTESRSGDLT